MRLYYFLLLLVMMGCTKEIELEQEPYERKIVVDGWIENDKGAQVVLTMSSPFLTEYDSASIRNTFLNYAKVTLITGSGEKEVLTLTQQKNFFPPFIYKSINIKGEVGENYRLEVVYRNKLIKAQTTIPKLPEIQNVWCAPVSDSSMLIKAELLDNANERNYYYSQINVKHIDTRFHPSDDPLINDNLFDGDQLVFQVKRKNQADPLKIHDIDNKRPLLSYEFALTDTVYVKISQIDQLSYKILNGIHFNRMVQGSPFTFVDQKTNTNIEGGIGRWTGLASRNYLIYHEK